jgi:phage baseplate assembly protein V
MIDEDDIPLDPSTLIRLGTISAVTLSPPRCKVRFGDPDEDDGDIETPPIRWLALRSGATRRWSPPTVGEEVVLLCPDGQIGNGVALCGLYNDNNPPPGATLAEIIAFADGALLSYDPSTHALHATLPAGSSFTVRADAITLDAAQVNATGDFHCAGTITGDTDVITGGKSLKNHRHGGVQGGSAQTLPPA